MKGVGERRLTAATKHVEARERTLDIGDSDHGPGEAQPPQHQLDDPSRWGEVSSVVSSACRARCSRKKEHRQRVLLG
jgi:hypothetical protein